MDIDNWIAELHRHGAQEVEQYHQKLRNFGSNEQKVFELLSEARTALLFLKNRWRVTMRDKPDLLLEYDGVSIYGEVKHMNEKETDRLDAEAMAKADPFEFVQVGSVSADEGGHGWEQMCRIAIKKESQYLEGQQNVLIFVSYSESLDLLLQSAVSEFDDKVREAGAESPLRKLGGMVMISNIYGPSTGFSNVSFCPTLYASEPISLKLASVLRCGQLA